MLHQLVRALIIVGFLPLAAGFPVLAQETNSPDSTQQIIVRVDGASCPFCAFGLEKRLSHLEGVAQVRMERKEGKAIVILKKGAKVSEQALRQAVDEAGFTPREIIFPGS